MAVDLSEYKEAIANAYEGRAVRDAIVAMVQAVEDAINAGGGSELDTRVTELEQEAERLDQFQSTLLLRIDTNNASINSIERALYGESGSGGLRSQIYELNDRVTALEGGSTHENDT